MSVPTVLHELLDRAAGRSPDAVAISIAEDRLTFRELARASHALAGWLTATGVGRGDRVVLAVPSGATVPALLFACSRVGAVFVLLGEQTPRVVAAHVLADAQPALVVTAQPTIGGAAVERGIACANPAAVRAAANGPGRPEPVAAPLPVDPVCFVYTSGSTAMPKAVVSTHQQLLFAVAAIGDRLAYTADDTVFVALPLFFDYGLYQLFLAAAAGARVHLASRRATGQALLAELRASAASVFPAVPTLAGTLSRLLARSAEPLPRLRLLTNTGAAMPEPVLAALRGQLPDLRVQLMYGLTECKRATIMPPDGDLDRPGSCGLALPGTEVFAVDEDGTRLAPGEIGELVVRGPHVMAGYWRRPELSAQRFRRADGLFPQLHTGDHGRVDADGHLYFVGRRDDLYKERGTRVSAVEVSTAAQRVPGVRAATVVPPSGAENEATLVVEAALSAPEVLRALHDQLEAGKVPGRCVVVDRMPVTANGKIARNPLREVGHG